MSIQEYDLLVIGSGPAGQKAAIAAAKARKRVAIVDRPAMLGGVSVHAGTIPSKTIREAVFQLTRSGSGSPYRQRHASSSEISLADVAARVDEIVVRETEVIRQQLTRNARNVFVAAGSTDCLVIDYANVERGAPACLDPACLEVDLVLSKARPSRFLRSAYAWPLRPLSPVIRQECDTWLWEAVRSLRIEGDAQIDHKSYAIAVVGYLLRLARLKSESVSIWRRAIAVCIAEWLLCQLHNEQATQTTTV